MKRTGKREKWRSAPRKREGNLFSDEILERT
jgi:hypothetical protein